MDAVVGCGGVVYIHGGGQSETFDTRIQDLFDTEILINRRIHNVLQVLQRAVLGGDQAVAAVDNVEEDAVLVSDLRLQNDRVLCARIVSGREYDGVLPQARLEVGDGRGCEFEPFDAQALELRGLSVCQLLGVSPAAEGLEDKIVVGGSGLRWKGDAGQAEGALHWVDGLEIFWNSALYGTGL